MALKLLTPEKYIIAEFIYSYQNDILIKSDAIELVNVLVKHELISKNRASKLIERVNENAKGIAFALFKIVKHVIDQSMLNLIMKEYYGTN